MIWRRRRSRARSVAARSGQGRTGWDSSPVQATERPAADPAWRMDPRRQPQVALNPQADAARLDARTDVYSVSGARPTTGRLGAQMPSVYCTRCGEANPENARFCSQCGTPLTRTDQPTAGETTSMIFTGAEAQEGELRQPDIQLARLGFRQHCADIAGGHLAPREHVGEQIDPFGFDTVGNHCCFRARLMRRKALQYPIVG